MKKIRGTVEAPISCEPNRGGARKLKVGGPTSRKGEAKTGNYGGKEKKKNRKLEVKKLSL